MSQTFVRTFGQDDPFASGRGLLRDAIIRGDGGIVFEQRNVEAPVGWSDQAVNIVASKYFRGNAELGQRETSIFDMVARVVNTITRWGEADGYFDTPASRDAFRCDLAWLILNQYATFNSPVWFNVGIDEKPQISACYLTSVDDSMESILDNVKTEGMVFKHGSGVGVNLSRLRSSKERLSGGGTPSGPVSFMKGYDAFAGIIKSGGKSRRAACLRVLNVDHPDILEFVRSKAKEEKKAHALIGAGYDGSFAGEAYSSVAFQNANHSVRVTDEFMECVAQDREWTTRAVSTGEPVETMRSRDLFREICQAAWECGDPGIQFHDEVNRWHTHPWDGPIEEANACLSGGERLFTSMGWQRIKTLVGKGFYLYDGFTFSPAKASLVGHRRVVRVVTNDGRHITVTPDHLLFTTAGWKPASECVGASLPIRLPEVRHRDGLSGCHITGGSDKYYCATSPQVMEVLGFLLGDGTIRPGQKIVQVYHTPEKDGEFVADKVLPLLSDMSVGAGETYTPGVIGHKNGHAFCRAKLYDWLLKIGMPTESLPERDVPEFVFKAPPSSQASFLRGLFGANGNVCNDAAEAVRLTAASYGMLQSAQLLLQGLGIQASVRRKSAEKAIEWHNGTYTSKEAYYLDITHSQDVARFAAMVGFPQDTQQRKLETIIKSSGNIRDNAARGVMTVVSVDDVGEEDVFDFEVMTTHAGIASGLIVHNCSEVVEINNTSCNLATLNLVKFWSNRGFDVEHFKAAIRILITAQDICIDRALYPTPAIERNTKELRMLGLNYANLGALLMVMGLPYDSAAGREVAASITAIMTATAYCQSSELAGSLGAFRGCQNEHMAGVIDKHLLALGSSNGDLAASAWRTMYAARDLARAKGVRNSQVTVLAPTGTVSFMLDCDTTGVEPAIALVSHKSMSDGGGMKMTVRCVERAIQVLGHTAAQVADIEKWIKQHGTVVGAPHLSEKNYPIFDTAFGSRPISIDGHLKMMAAVQPFLSGAISKTCNLPSTATVEDVEHAYMDAWSMGLKSVTIYRDGSKGIQPLKAVESIVAGGKVLSLEEVKEVARLINEQGPALLPEIVSSPHRLKLEQTRNAVTHKFEIAGQEGYITVGLYEDGSPGEVFLRMSKAGSTLNGLLDALAIVVSNALQYGVPLQALVKQLSHIRFEPAGMTTNSEIKFTTSIVDYVFRWMELRFLSAREEEDDDEYEDEPATAHVSAGPEYTETVRTHTTERNDPPCPTCGAMLVRTGTCMACTECGYGGGCS